MVIPVMVVVYSEEETGFSWGMGSGERVVPLDIQQADEEAKLFWKLADDLIEKRLDGEAIDQADINRLQKQAEAAEQRGRLLRRQTYHCAHSHTHEEGGFFFSHEVGATDNIREVCDDCGAVVHKPILLNVPVSEEDQIPF